MSAHLNEGSDSVGAIVLAGQFQIHPNKPLPQLDSPMANAVAASDQRSPGREMFALVCRPDLLPRIDFIPQVSRLDRIPLVSPVDAGAVDWPETGGRRLVIVFDKNFGGRVCESSSKTIPPMGEDQLVRTVVQPLVVALNELTKRHIPHRAIRADNLFYADASCQSVILGECVSAPPGLSQPVLYEPIDSAISKPSARGFGTTSDDLYAFGALLAFLLTGGEALAGMSDQEIIEAKIDCGSYAALIGQTRVSLGIMEPLRGLLCDDPKERWTVADLELWMGGRKHSPKQPVLPVRAARSIAVGTKECWTKLALYHAIGVHWSGAGQIVTGDGLEKWLRRALSDEETGEAVADVIQMAAETSDGADRLMSKTLIVLEPTMPLRYMGLAARIDGLTGAFAIDYHDQGFRRTFVDLVDSKLPQTYLQSQVSPRSDQTALMKTFDLAKFFLDRRQMGAGLERALYESNPGWPCQSPLIQDQYVYEIGDLLPALERVAARGDSSQEFVDRHIAAFCAARISSFPERVLRELDSHDDLVTFRLGVLHLLAEVQRVNNGKRKCSVLCQRMARAVQPVVESFHNRAYRRRLSEEIDGVSGKGDLLEMLFLVDSLEARDQDIQGFDRAKREYAGHERTLAWLRGGGLTSVANVQFKSQQAATLMSATAAAITIIALSLIYVI